MGVESKGRNDLIWGMREGESDMHSSHFLSWADSAHGERELWKCSRFGLVKFEIIWEPPSYLGLKLGGERSV